MECPCGWCLTGDHNNCKLELLVDRKLYICGCKKCSEGHVPSVGVESVAKEKKQTDSVKEPDADNDD